MPYSNLKIIALQMQTCFLLKPAAAVLCTRSYGFLKTVCVAQRPSHRGKLALKLPISTELSKEIEQTHSHFLLNQKHNCKNKLSITVVNWFKSPHSSS